MTDDELSEIKERHQAAMDGDLCDWTIEDADRAWLIVEVERLRAENAKLREALELAAGDLDAAAEDAGRSYYADRAQAARESAHAAAPSLGQQCFKGG